MASTASTLANVAKAGTPFALGYGASVLANNGNNLGQSVIPAVLGLGVTALGSGVFGKLYNRKIMGKQREYDAARAEALKDVIAKRDAWHRESEPLRADIEAKREAVNRAAAPVNPVNHVNPVNTVEDLEAAQHAYNSAMNRVWEKTKAHGALGQDGKLLSPDDMQPLPGVRSRGNSYDDWRSPDYPEWYLAPSPEAHTFRVLNELRNKNQLAPDLEPSWVRALNAEAERARVSAPLDAEAQIARKALEEAQAKSVQASNAPRSPAGPAKEEAEIALRNAEGALKNLESTHWEPVVQARNAMIDRKRTHEAEIRDARGQARLAQGLAFAGGSGLSAIGGGVYGSLVSPRDDSENQKSSKPQPPPAKPQEGKATVDATRSVGAPTTATGPTVNKGPGTPENNVGRKPAPTKTPEQPAPPVKTGPPDAGGTKTPPPVKSEIPWGKIGLGVAGVGAAGLLAAYLYNHFNKPKKKNDSEEG
jgi:hypothetical protein